MSISVVGRFRAALVHASLSFFMLCLVGCQGSGAGRAAGGQVVFVDVAGNQMVVDVVGKAAKGGDDINPSDGGDHQPLPQTESSADELSWAGEIYEDSGSLESRVKDRSADRFFVVPDGSGHQQLLTAGLLGVATDGVDDARAPVPLHDAEWIHCANPVALALLPVATQRRHNLVFPVINKGLRYVGYRLPLPAGVQAVSVWSYIRKGGRVDALTAAVNDDGNIAAVVNNIATETVPESMFRYGSVGGRVSLVGETAAVPKELAVLDGKLLRNSVSQPCWPSVPDVDALSSGGVVTLEFSGGTGE